MKKSFLSAALSKLDNEDDLLSISEEVDPDLVAATLHLQIHQQRGPAILFEKIKGSKYRACSNLFGTIERSKMLLGNNFEKVRRLIALRNDPRLIFKNFFSDFSSLAAAYKALPKKIPARNINRFEEVKISDLPLIKHWPDDGGAFITLPQVYTEDIDRPGPQHSNIGMYRIQLSGNEYKLNQEIGLHYQIHRGIGVHQTKSNAKGKPLKVSVFVGGPVAHSIAAVMPLPEAVPEISFAGVLAGRRFRYFYNDGFCISADADFVITGTVDPGDNKPEGPFGDHLGYYSLKHDFPLMKVHKVFAKPDGIWPFTVVGRPPQEDTAFGALIHELTGDALQKEIPGLRELNAVDAAGVHPLLLAIGSERYTPYSEQQSPSEILTIANHMLGKGQLSLVKFLLIVDDPVHSVSVNDIPAYFKFLLERIDPERDLHFLTNTSIDTLDYSGTGLNTGSKLIMAAAGEKKRELCVQVPKTFAGFESVFVMPGVIAIKFPVFESYENAARTFADFEASITEQSSFSGVVLIIAADDPQFVSASLNNFLWVSFTRVNPSHDIYGIKSHTVHKHWGCEGPLILDARRKPHHAPPLITDAQASEKAKGIIRNSKLKI